MAEKYGEFAKRKMSEIESLVQIAKDHPHVISNFQIIDTAFKDALGQFHPVRRIILELNESVLKELKEAK